jgi:hypothetical protein
MSWHIKKVGKGLDVAPEIGKAVEKELENNYHSDEAKAVIHAHSKAITSFAELNPTTMVIVSTSGHMDSAGGSADLKLERVF